jgi:HK97 family phage prohead protease
MQEMEARKINNGERELRCQLSDVRIEQRDGESGGRTVTGYAAKFDKWSEPICGWFTEQIRAGAFDGCDTTDAIMCFNHNVDGILARTASKTLTLEVDEVGLCFSFEAPNTTLGNDMVELLRRGDIDKCSFSFVVGQDEWTYADEKNGLKHDKRTILKISKLYDVALVVYPAYPDTEASVRHLEERKAEFLRSREPEGGSEGGGTENGPETNGPDGVDIDSGPDGGTPQGAGLETTGTTRQGAPPPTPETDGDPPATEQAPDTGSASRRRTAECLELKSRTTI